MSLLIAGARGFLGKSIVHAEVGNNDVLSIDRSHEPGTFELRAGNRVLAEGPIEGIAPIVRDQGVSCLINVSGEVTKERSFQSIPKLIRANVEYPCLLAELAVVARIPRIVHASTFSHTTDGANYKPQTLYASTKRAIEDVFVFYSQQQELQILSLEVYDLYGPNQSHGRIFDLLYKSLVTGEELKLHGDGYQEISPLYVEDAAQAFISAASMTLDNQKRFINFSVPGSSVVTIRNLASTISDSLGMNFSPGQLQFGFDPPVPTVRKVNLSHSILPGLTHQTTLEDGLKKTYGYL
jgi:CDP-3, 6-dideoxy-D-glycero-L-glycero-4-hexulose-4-reductase